MIETAAFTVEPSVNEDIFNYIRELVSPEKKIRLNAFRNPMDRIRSMAGEHLVRKILKTRYNRDPHSVITMEDSMGKPYVADMEDFHYNISHSGRWIVCSYGDNPVGVDVEKIKPMDMAIARHYFTESERDSVFSAPEDESLKIFFKIWTLKESYVKCIGRGLSIDLKSFSTYPGIDIIKTDEPSRAVRRFKEYSIDEGYCLSVCSSSSYFGEDVELLPLT